MVTLSEEQVNAIRNLFYELTSELAHRTIKGIDDVADWYADEVYKEAEGYDKKFERILRGEIQ